MINDLIAYIVDKTGNNQAVENYIKTNDKQDLVCDGKFYVSEKCIEFLMGELVSNNENRQQFDTYLQQAYQVFKKNTGNANDKEVQALFFAEITEPYLKYIKEFTNDVFENSNITQYLKTTTSFKDRSVFVTAYILLVFCICAAIILGIIIGISVARDEVKKLIIVIIVMCLMTVLTGLGGVGVLFYGRKNMRQDLREFVGDEDFIDMVIKNPKWYDLGTIGTGTTPIDLRKLQGEKMNIRNLADIVLGQIEWKTIFDALESNSDLPASISAMIMSYVFDDEMSEKITGLVGAQKIYLEKFIPPATVPPFRIESNRAARDTKYEEEADVEHKVTALHSLKTPLLTANYAMTELISQTPSEPGPLLIDIQENPGDTST